MQKILGTHFQIIFLKGIYMYKVKYQNKHFFYSSLNTRALQHQANARH